MISNIVMVGCGGVGFCLLELFKLEKLYANIPYFIVEPRDIPDLEEVMTGRKYKHLKGGITVENCRRILSPNLDENSLLVNLSVNVDSIMLLKLCKDKGAHYIDASLEQYEPLFHADPENVERYEQFRDNNLFHQNIKAMETVGNTRKTRIISCGANPYGVNQFFKEALIRYGKTRGKRLIKGNYAKLAHELGLKEIQVVEYDSQKLKVHATPEKFINTWSSIGFQEEASDNVMFSLNNEDEKDLSEHGLKLIKPKEKGFEDTHIRFLPSRGMNMVRDSIALDRKGNAFNYTGFCIPHAEIITLSEFLQYRGNAPTCMYVYRPSDEAIKSLGYFKDANYKNLPDFEVVRNADVIEGDDSIGALLTFENGDRYGGWTVCGQEDVKRLGIRSNATCCQVAGYMLASIKYIIKNRLKGINNAETIPHKFILKYAEPYLGKIFFKKV
jgi:homospermidine synthase